MKESYYIMKKPCTLVLPLFNKKAYDKSFPGFTLAEVLITIVIIGVIAAITVPVIVSEYQKKNTTIKLEKAYTTLVQAIRLSEIYNGPTTTWDYTLTSDQFMKKYLEPFFIKLKKDSTQNLKNRNVEYKYLNNVKYTNDLFNKGTYIITQDNTMFFVDNWFPTDGSSRWLAIDINGYKGPNILGKDAYAFAMYKAKGLSAPESTRENRINSCYSGGNYCIYIIMSDGWQIKKDYPWN